MNAPNDLLHQLRIDRSPPPPTSKPRWPWFVGLGAVALGVAVAFAALREEPVPVRTAVAEADIAGSAPTVSSVLDATGYVTARRMATVSSKITGKVLEVL